MLGDAEELLDAKTQWISDLENFIKSKNLKIPDFDLKLKPMSEESPDTGEFI